MSSTAIDTHSHGHHGEHPHGALAWLTRWITTTNHKEIGTLYLMFSLLMLFVGGGMAMVIRAELFQPGLQFVNPVFFNQMTTVHALVMVFAMIMPAFAGFANWTGNLGSETLTERVPGLRDTVTMLAFRAFGGGIAA